MSNEPSTASTPREIDEAVKRAMQEAADLIQNTHLPTHWRSQLEYLDDNFAFFLTHVLNMGRPTWDPSIRTAAVALPGKGAKMEDFHFLFNPTFAALLTTEELAFVAAHETMHVLLNHLL